MDGAMIFRKYRFAAAYAVVWAGAFWLLFHNLDGHLLWGDEAETATLAKNVMQFGLPRTFDGTNYLILHGTLDETPDHVWTWSPWAQEYITASSFILLGTTTWAARFPFALIGWISVALLGLVIYRIYRSHGMALAGMLLLATSEAFLLHARQCRYYSISMMGEIILICGLYLLLAQDRRGVWVTALALVLQFYSNYIVVAGNIPVLLGAGWVLHRQRKPAWGNLAAIFLILAVAALPWLVYARPWRQAQAVGGDNYFLKMWGYGTEFHFHFVPVFFLALLLWFLTGNRRAAGGGHRPPAARSWEFLLLFLVGTYLAVITAAPGFYMRYMLPLLPVSCSLTAIFIVRYVKWRSVAAGLIFLLAASNLLSLLSAPFGKVHGLRFPLVEYVRGLQSGYADKFSDVLDYLGENARSGQRILTPDPEFPLVFYTGLGVINARIVGPPPGQLPDWIFPVPASGVVEQLPLELPEFLKPHYEAVTLSVHDSSLGGNVPEPDFYQYQASQSRVPFTLYKLKTPPARLPPADSMSPQ